MAKPDVKGFKNAFRIEVKREFIFKNLPARLNSMVQSAMLEAGKEGKKFMRQDMLDKGISRFGRTYRSSAQWKVSVDQKDNTHILLIKPAGDRSKIFRFIDSGRAGKVVEPENKQPRTEQILEWMESRGIEPDYEDERKTAFIIARLIGKWGIPAKHIARDTLRYIQRILPSIVRRHTKGAFLRTKFKDDRY